MPSVRDAFGILAFAAAASLPSAAFAAAPADAAPAPLAPRVMVITMFQGEASPWLENLSLDRTVTVPGLAPRYPAVHCNAEATLCMATTDMGYANAASSITTLVHSARFDLRKTWFIVAGIGGIDPHYGTLGSAHWARYAVDGGLNYSVDPRQVPDGWPSGVLALGSNRPGQQGDWNAGTELYRLNEKFLQRAFALSEDVELLDTEDAQAYRANYPYAPGNKEPKVSICDTLSSDTYWHGSLMAAAMMTQVAVVSDGKAHVCTTQMEDNATLTALKRGAEAGLLDFDRIAVLRTGSNFDREAPGQSVAASLRAKSGGFLPAVTNAYRVADAVAENIIEHWSDWRDGVPEKN